MNPGEIYTAPDGRKYRAEKRPMICDGCAFERPKGTNKNTPDCKIAPPCLGVVYKRIPDITYSTIESLRTGRAWPGGVPDSNSFHFGANAMAEHLGFEVETTT